MRKILQICRICAFFYWQISIFIEILNEDTKIPNLNLTKEIL